jgi:predicted enzyme related to lactoylglutathione lyase
MSGEPPERPVRGTPLLRKVDCIRVYVPDLDEGIAFYRDRLGHTLNWRSATAAGLRMSDSDAEIVVHTERPGAETDLLVDDADAAAREIVAGGGKIVVPAFDIAIGRCVVAADPWGNTLVLLDMSKGRLETDANGNVVG